MVSTLDRRLPGHSLRKELDLNLLLRLTICALLAAAPCLAEEGLPDFQSLPTDRGKAMYLDARGKYGAFSRLQLQALADQGHPSAGLMLAEMLLEDPDDATRQVGLALLISLAHQRYSDAQYQPATEYWFGRTVKRDQTLAILWHRQSLRSGNISTAGIWAHMYDPQSAKLRKDGTLLQPDVAVAPDPVLSLMWHLVAFEMGYPQSSYQIIVPRYEKLLTAEEFADAKARAAKCIASSFEDCSWPER
jgi:hypothetical protein